jgi:hypothetical protein
MFDSSFHFLLASLHSAAVLIFGRTWKFGESEEGADRTSETTNPVETGSSVVEWPLGRTICSKCSSLLLPKTGSLNGFAY